MTPDLPSMSGGLRVIYALVEHLNTLGFDACVWHGVDIDYDSFESSAPVVVGLDQVLQPGDVLVMPEVGGSKWADLNPQTPVVMLVQGSDFVFADAGFEVGTEHAYPGWPQATAAVTVSQTLAQFLAGVLPPGFPLYRVPLVIDTDLYRPLTKEPLVAFMPRRRREDMLGVVHLLHRRGAFSEHWALQPIDAMSVRQVADIMGRAAIFLNGGEREGFGLPGAEALAAGCHLIGFSGHGGREYMVAGISEVIAESDVVAMADGVLAAMREYDEAPADFALRSQRGRDLVQQRFGRAAQATALSAAFAQLTAPGSGSVISTPVVAHHYSSRAPHTSVARAYVAARTAAGRLRRRFRS